MFSLPCSSMSSSSISCSLKRDASLVPLLRSLLDEAGVRRNGERTGKARARATVDARGVISPSPSSSRSSLNRDAFLVLTLKSVFDVAGEIRGGEPAGIDKVKGGLSVISLGPSSFESSLNRGARSGVNLRLAFEHAGESFERTGKAKVRGSIDRLAHNLRPKV